MLFKFLHVSNRITTPYLHMKFSWDEQINESNNAKHAYDIKLQRLSHWLFLLQRRHADYEVDLFKYEDAQFIVCELPPESGYIYSLNKGLL